MADLDGCVKPEEALEDQESQGSGSLYRMLDRWTDLSEVRALWEILGGGQVESAEGWSRTRDQECEDHQTGRRQKGAESNRNHGA